MLVFPPPKELLVLSPGKAAELAAIHFSEQIESITSNLQVKCQTPLVWGFCTVGMPFLYEMIAESHDELLLCQKQKEDRLYLLTDRNCYISIIRPVCRVLAIKMYQLRAAGCSF